MKKSIFIFLAVTLWLSFCNTGCKTKASKEETPLELKLDGQWKFAQGDDLQRAKPEFDDSRWTNISSTDAWENQGFTDYDGFGWYRRTFTIPPEWKPVVEKNGGIIIKYDNVDDVDECFFNGFSVGKTGIFPPNYETKCGAKRKYKIPAEYVKFGETNSLAVRVYDGGGPGGLLSGNTTVSTMTAIDAVDYSYSFPAEEWIFMSGRPQQINLKLENKNAGKSIGFNAILILKTDKFAPVDSISTPIGMKGMEVKNMGIGFKLPEPGFYRCTFYLEQGGVRSEVHQFNIGYEPEKIVSPRDAKPDFEEFWKKSRAELDKVAPNYKLTLIPERSAGARNIYHVEMMSFGNVKVEGYYAAPKARGKYPAIAVYMGYGSDAYFPDSNGNPGFAEFILSVRGQGIQKPANTYGDWIVWGLDSKENYYYRGAFMDLVRAVDFLVSRPEVDSEKIVAEGGSQGGAFTLAACALDHRIKAGAPTVPFLTDYRDYFEIVGWPRSSFENYLAQNPNRTWDEVYDILTYFDIKNFAEWIQCPVLMAVGLQDEVCPPHTNFASYNLIKGEKQYRIYHDEGHSVPNSWYQLRSDFFNEKIGLK